MINCTKESKEILENKRDLVIGLGTITGIIAAIIIVVIVMLPEESETIQNESVVESGNIEFDPRITSQAEESIPSFHTAFRTVIEECNSVESYSDYIAYVNYMLSERDVIAEGTAEMNKALTSLELLGYAQHPTVGPMIKEARKLAGAAGDCMIELQERYGN